jgi:peptidylprolyl isomerase
MLESLVVDSSRCRMRSRYAAESISTVRWGKAAAAARGCVRIGLVALATLAGSTVACRNGADAPPGAVDLRAGDTTKPAPGRGAPKPPPPDVAAPPADAERTASGLASRVLRAGRGSEHPAPDGVVTVHYTGWTTDGRMFDSSESRGEPVTFPLNRAVPGWSEGVQRMVVGERRRLWIPEALAYRGRPGMPAGTLVFDVELISFAPAPTRPPVPPDVAAPPPDAQRSTSGLAWKVLQPGRSDERPDGDSLVEVQFTTWTPDGVQVESTVERGRPSILPVSHVIPAWREALVQMRVGERRRLWAPASLAYGGRGGPVGPVVFDLELVRIVGQ